MLKRERKGPFTIKDRTFKYVIYANVMLRLLMGIKHPNITFHDHTSTFCQVSVTCMKLRYFLFAINQTEFCSKQNLKNFSLKAWRDILFVVILDYNPLKFVGSIWISNSQNHISFIWHMSLIKEMRNCWIEMLACRKGKWFSIRPMKKISFNRDSTVNK